MPREKYAEMFETDEWVACPIDGMRYFLSLKDQNKNSHKRTCSEKCANVSKEKSKRKSGYYDEDRQKAKGKRTGKTLREAGHYEHDKASKRGKKGAETRRAKGDFESEAFLQIAKDNLEKARADRIKNPEKYKKIAQDVANIKRKNGDYDFDKMSRAAEKGKKSRLEKDPDSYKKSAEKTVKTKRERHYFESEAFKQIIKTWQAAALTKDSIEKGKQSRKKSYFPGKFHDRNVLIAKKKKVYDFWNSESYKRGRIKAHDTMKKEGTLGRKISYREIAFALFLQSIFDEKAWNIHWQIKIGSKDERTIFGDMFNDFNKQLEPDFFITDKKNNVRIIIFFDGVFIHGLDRPIIEIARKSLTSLFNASIFKKYYSDRSFEDYCQKKNINLIRFDEGTFEDFLFKNEKLIPYFTCGKSDELDLVLDKI